MVCDGGLPRLLSANNEVMNWFEETATKEFTK